MTKILIVEDDQMLSEIYQRKFSEADFEVVMAASGTEAQAKAKTENPFVILLDLVLPEEDGFEVLRKIKTDPVTNTIKVIIFSNLSQEEDKEKARSLGADGFIAKSDFTPHQIVDQVRTIVGHPAAEEPKVVEISELPDEEKKISLNGNGNGDEKKVLLIEDEQVFVEVFGKKLQENGFKVEVAKNGSWGEKKANEKKYDLIIMDILMPNMDGEELIGKIKTAGENKETPIIAISNSIEDEKVHHISDLGINEFFVKTRITPSELSAKASQLIG